MVDSSLSYNTFNSLILLLLLCVSCQKYPCKLSNFLCRSANLIMKRSRSLTLRTNNSSQEEIKDLPQVFQSKVKKSNSRKVARSTASGPGEKYLICPGARLSGAQLSRGPVVRGPTVRPPKVANWAPDSWAPGPGCPGPNCPPPKSGKSGPGQLGPRTVGPRTVGHPCC